jgi:hypothetical protein
MRLTLGLALAAVLAAGAFASGGGSAAFADCSKAEATAIVKRLHLGYADYLANPVSRVICGAFVGPGSRAMVALLPSGGASGLSGWVVFRLVGDAWQPVLERDGGGQISAAGSDIRETVFILRPGDARCCPSGGTKARLWHWNGARFAAGPWKQATPGTPSAAGVFRSGYFKTPSGNIVCYHSPGPADLRRAFLGCGIKSGLKPAPPRRPCEEGGYAGDRVSINATGRVSVPACAGDPGALVGAREARVLGYGKTWSGGGLSCASAVAGLTCRNKSGHGFFLSRAQWRAF